MKLIIDIPDNEYKQNKHYYDSVYHGIPLDSVKAEIRELRDSWEKDCYHDEAEALNIVLKIIDKHIGKTEGEDK